MTLKELGISLFWGIFWVSSWGFVGYLLSQGI